jgi:hypothetical protein
MSVMKRLILLDLKETKKLQDSQKRKDKALPTY